MANWEMWDELSEVSPDYDYLLDIRPTTEYIEEGDCNQVVHQGDDDSDAVVTISSDSVFYVSIQFENISESDAGTIMDLYHDSSKANRRARSFKWKNYGEYSDSHDYTVKFVSAPRRIVKSPFNYTVDTIKLKVLGRTPA
jgi:hypothetical protein